MDSYLCKKKKKKKKKIFRSKKETRKIDSTSNPTPNPPNPIESVSVPVDNQPVLIVLHGLEALLLI